MDKVECIDKNPEVGIEEAYGSLLISWRQFKRSMKLAVRKDMELELKSRCAILSYDGI